MRRNRLSLRDQVRLAVGVPFDDTLDLDLVGCAHLLVPGLLESDGLKELQHRALFDVGEADHLNVSCTRQWGFVLRSLLGGSSDGERSQARRQGEQKTVSTHSKPLSGKL